ncbi:MAG: FAD-dependent oxidoreductase, partial [Verrucomicrobiota bacterium]
KLLTTVIVGGGPTGVELAGAIAELSRTVMKNDFRNIDPAEAKIYLVEMAPRLLTMYSEDLSQYTADTLTKKGVNVLTSDAVGSIEANKVELSSTTIHAETIIWAAGVEAPEITRNLGVEVDRGGRFIVKTDLSLPDHPNVFAIGDIASCVDQAEVRVPGVCPAAIQMGKHASEVIKHELSGRGAGYSVRPQFRYWDKGSMAIICKSCAVASSMGLKFTGFIAWGMWLFIHLLFLTGSWNRFAVTSQWIYAILRNMRSARIITG